MGMDVIGKKPTTEEGKYFRNNVWWWRPLATYVCEVAPDIADKCHNWQTNDGDGLKAKDARQLADILQKEIDIGHTEAYARRYASDQEMAPDVACDLCGGTGTRKPIPHIGAGDPKADGVLCNKCDGKGHVRPWSTEYPFSVENVQTFAIFLRGCGGFKIC